MSAGRVILCDVDEVCADLMTEWVRRYNARWDDTLRPEDITDWDIVRFVKPECGSKVYNELRSGDDIYQGVEPIPGALEGIRELRRTARVVFVTSCVAGSTDNKMRWLFRHGFLPREKTPRDFIAARDKALVRGDILIDDAPHNVSAFPGRTILFSQPHNRAVAHSARANGWTDVVRLAGELSYSPVGGLL